jgi:hypothetical protein
MIASSDIKENGLELIEPYGGPLVNHSRRFAREKSYTFVPRI